MRNIVDRLSLAAGILALQLLFGADAIAEWYKHQADIMGTRISVELFHHDAAVARQGIEVVIEEMHRIDAGMSPYIASSELSHLNSEASRRPIKVSAELFSLIRRSIEFSELTHGAFDITFASAGYLYDYRQAKRPTARQLQESIDLINYHNLVLDPASGTIRYSREGIRIDLGGIAKGYAVDNCIELLRKLGIRSALVSAGGDSRVIGDRWGRPWTIGVRDPRKENNVVALLPLADVAVSTSGDYERYFEEGGIRYHHIIDPKSGDSARELQSVTIIGPDATTTDALSTSVFVLGLARGLHLVNRLPNIDAILVDRFGTMHYSDGLESARNMDSSVNPSAEPVVR
ncbi:MAG: FAD:protein FMN transferase [Thiogranum sp.]|nr:FAD:protein FMN transferase [Thiogranum sp.]